MGLSDPTQELSKERSGSGEKEKPHPSYSKSPKYDPRYMPATAVMSVMLTWIVHIVSFIAIPNEWQKPQMAWQVWCFNK